MSWNPSEYCCKRSHGSFDRSCFNGGPTTSYWDFDEPQCFTVAGGATVTFAVKDGRGGCPDNSGEHVVQTNMGPLAASCSAGDFCAGSQQNFCGWHITTPTC